VSDFGTDVGNTTIQAMGNVTTKTLELIGEIFKALLQYWLNSNERKIAQMKLDGMKDEKAKKEFLDEIDGKVGFVSHEELMKAGVPIIPIEMSMSEEDFQKFSELCKENNVMISGVMDVRDMALNGKKSFILECKQQDLEKIKNLVELFNDQKKIKDYEGRIEEIKKKAERIDPDTGEVVVNLSDQDKFDISFLRQKIQEFKDGFSKSFNDAQSKSAIDKALYGNIQDGMTLDGALNELINREINKDTTFIVADAKDPKKHIVCESKPYVFQGNPSVKTNYTVYDGVKKVFKGNDEQIVGRNHKEYWKNLKESIRNSVGIGDFVYRFNNANDYSNYVKELDKLNKVGLTNTHLASEKINFDAVYSELMYKLMECGAEYKNGVIIDSASQKPIMELNPESPMIGKALMLGEQLQLYQYIQKIENEYVRAHSMMTQQISAGVEYQSTVNYLNELKGYYSKALNDREILIDKLETFNATIAKEKSEKEIKDYSKTDDSRDDVIINDTRNYSSIVLNLKDELLKYNVVYVNETLYNSRVGLPLNNEDTSYLTSDQIAHLDEINIIGNQIKNYAILRSIREDYITAHALMESSKRKIEDKQNFGNPEDPVTQKEINELQEQINEVNNLGNIYGQYIAYEKLLADKRLEFDDKNEYEQKVNENVKGGRTSTLKEAKEKVQNLKKEDGAGSKISDSISRKVKERSE